jgi:hypothetical protein
MASHSLHRPVTFARRGMVVAPHYLAAEAGLELRQFRRRYGVPLHG